MGTKFFCTRTGVEHDETIGVLYNAEFEQVVGVDEPDVDTFGVQSTTPLSFVVGHEYELVDTAAGQPMNEDAPVAYDAPSVPKLVQVGPIAFYPQEVRDVRFSDNGAYLRLGYTSADFREFYFGQSDVPQLRTVLGLD